MSKIFSLVTSYTFSSIHVNLSFYNQESSKTNSERILWHHETGGNPIKRWPIFLEVQTEKQILLKIPE